MVQLPLMEHMAGQTVPFAHVRKRLWDELVIAHDSWEQYVTLFAHSDERVRMLNACAGWFFATTQRTLLREVILSISRLTDPIKSGSFDNLVIASLLSDSAIDSHDGLRDAMQAAVDAAVSKAASVRVHRNKYVAHLDHATALGTGDQPLPGLRREDISEAIDLLEKAYNLHGLRVHQSQAFFDVGSMGSVPALLKILESSERWTKWRELHDEKGKAVPPAP